MAKVAVGQQVSYRVYDMTYSLSVDDSVGCSERIARGTITGVGKTGRILRVRNEATGRVESVLAHRVVR